MTSNQASTEEPMGFGERGHHQNGQGLVEFALIVTFLLILLMGVMDLGRAFYVYLVLQDAAQEGAAYGSTEAGDIAGIEARVRSGSSAPVNLSGPEVSVQVTYVDDYFPIGTICAGDAVQVTVSSNLELVTPFLGAVVGSQSIPLMASVSDTILRPPCAP